MFYYCATIITALIFYKILNIKFFYKILFCIVFSLFSIVIIGISSNVIFNVYCSLTDKIGYNLLTDYLRFFVKISDWIFLCFLTICLITFYYTNKK